MKIWKSVFNLKKESKSCLVQFRLPRFVYHALKIKAEKQVPPTTINKLMLGLGIREYGEWKLERRKKDE